MQDYSDCANIIQQQKNVTHLNSNNLIHQFNYIYKSQNHPYALQPRNHQQILQLQFKSPIKLQEIQSDQDLKNQKKQKKIRKESNNQNVNKGHWTQQQNKKYHLFLEIHYRHFVNRHMRRMDKIFKTMELFIGTRQAEQCRSHHQKMQKKYHIFTNIIQNLRKGHYETLSIQPILKELKIQKIQFKDSIKTMQQLLLMQQNNKEHFTKVEKRQKKQPKTPMTEVKMPFSGQLIQKDSIVGVLIEEPSVCKEQQRQSQSHDKIDMLQQSNNLASAYMNVVKQQNSSLLFYNMFQ